MFHKIHTTVHKPREAPTIHHTRDQFDTLVLEVYTEPIRQNENLSRLNTCNTRVANSRREARNRIKKHLSNRKSKNGAFRRFVPFWIQQCTKKGHKRNWIFNYTKEWRVWCNVHFKIPWMFSHVVASLDVNVATLTVVELFSLVFRFQI